MAKNSQLASDRESEILQSLLQEEPAEDPATDEATEAEEESVGQKDDTGTTIETEDGGAIIELDDAADVKKSAEFYANLAEDMDESVMNKIATELLELIEQDKTARKDRDKQYEEGLQRTGMGNDAPGGAKFEGASKVVLPLMTEVSVDFAARAIKELWPAGGPAKDFIPGEPDDRKEEKGKRKVKYMNWQLTQQMPSTRRQLEQILTQVPIAGNAYSKLWQDVRRKKPVHEPVWNDEILIPANASDFYSANRFTHVQNITEYEYTDRVRGGMYRDVDLISAGMLPDETRAEKANNKIEGVEPDTYNKDGLRTVLEVTVQTVVPDDHRGVTDVDDDSAYEQGPAPYLITIDATSRKVLSIYRNWDEYDETEESLVHVIEWPFIPWRGAMPIGTPQLLGGIAAAATGALRSLLDSAHINNFPGGMSLKAGPKGGQNVRIAATEINEIDGGINQDDIRKTFMPVPVNPTSPVLQSLMEYLVDARHEVIKTTLDEANDNANVPVGTTMARIEQGMVVFSAIHSRLHDAMGRFLKVLHRLDATWLDDELIQKQTGEKMAFKEDFDSPMDVIPVSDPEIFSELQRISQVQTIAARSQLLPQLYDQRKVEEAILERMKIKDAKSFLVPKPEPKPLNAINENIAAALGQPIVAFPAQNHLAHIQAHAKFIEDPMFGQNPLMAAQALPALLQNIKEHMLFQYGMDIHSVATEAANGKDITEWMSIKDAETASTFDGLMAAAANLVAQKNQAQYTQILQVISEAQAVLQKYQPPQPMDPSAVAGQKVQADQQKAQADNATKQQEIATQAQLDSQKLQLEQKKVATDAQLGASAQQQQMDETKMTLGAEKVKADSENATHVTTTGITAQAHLQGIAHQDQTKLAVTEQDNTVAEQIAEAEIEAGKHTNLKDGQAVGKKKA